MKNLLITVKVMIFAASAVFFLSNCCKNCDDPPVPLSPTGKIQLVFKHYVNDSPATNDKMMYWNAAGNHWELSEVQWFITDVTLHKKNGDKDMLDQWSFYHYVDTDIPSTLSWDIEDKVDTGTYSDITFTFGIKGERNEPFMFVNAPENQMFWPYHLGGDDGGYHYMKINGFWQDTNQFRRGFNFHLGVGQKQYSDGTRIKVWDPSIGTSGDSSYVFIQNWFEVTLPASTFVLEKDKTKQIEIIMNIDKWFTTPNDYNHNIWGPDIMENQAAMQKVKENGHDVFTVGIIKDL
ncbi:MbnP family protein [Bacteroidota bacterium]